MELLLGLWSCLDSLKRGQNCGTCSGDCGLVWHGQSSVRAGPSWHVLGQVAVSSPNKEDESLLLLLKAVDRALFLFSGTGWIVYVWVCVCARVWKQGRGRDKMRCVMHYSTGLCIVVMFHV